MTSYEEIGQQFLEHHGIKGQKWGVRKNRTYATESKELRKESGKNYRRESVEAFGKRIEKRTLTPDDYAKLSDKKEFIAKNATLRRVQSNTDVALSGKTYVSRLVKDAERYKAVLPNDNKIISRGGNKSYKQVYEVTFKTTKRLSAPSEKERVDTFTKLLSSPTVKVGRKTMTGREYLKRVGYRSEIRKLSDQEAGLKFYIQFNRTAGKNRNALSTAYFESLRAKGYQAVADDNDRHIVAKAPLILLNPNGAITVTSVRAISADEINKAQRSFQAL